MCDASIRCSSRSIGVSAVAVDFVEPPQVAGERVRLAVDRRAG